MSTYCLVIVCVFKQKTAYEMRISDWSSDVCSSDLVGHDRLVQQTNHYHAEGRITNLVRVARFREDQPLIEAFEKYEKATRRRQRSLRSIPDEISDLAIGRASCRERVCKYG